jgi:peroxiredoxin
LANTTVICDFGWKPTGFRLPATDGKVYDLETLAGHAGLVVMFICNHCPYVLSALERIIEDARDLQSLGVGVAAICSNDAQTYPEDSFEAMTRMAETQGFPFPYLHDESQQIARDWQAACTPDFFGFNAALELQYRGRLDAGGKKSGPHRAQRELFEAMREIAATGRGPKDQVPSIGCSIKWRAQ